MLSMTYCLTAWQQQAAMQLPVYLSLLKYYPDTTLPIDLPLQHPQELQQTLLPQELLHPLPIQVQLHQIPEAVLLIQDQVLLAPHPHRDLVLHIQDLLPQVLPHIQDRVLHLIPDLHPQAHHHTAAGLLVAVAVPHHTAVQVEDS